MRSENIAVIVLKTLFFDTIRDIIRFPFWWYTKGLLSIWKSFINGVINAERTTGVLVWSRNILTPMYGQYDLMGRFISVIIRVLQIMVRALVLVAWITLLFIKVVFWILVPVVIAGQIFYQVSGGFLTLL